MVRPDSTSVVGIKEVIILPEGSASKVNPPANLARWRMFDRTARNHQNVILIPQHVGRG